MKRLKKALNCNEFYVFLTIVALSLIIQARSHQFFTSNSLIDVLSAMTVPGLFAICALLVIISGGIDVSFPALASLATYAVTKYLSDIGFTGSPVIPILLAIGAGFLLGAFNGLLISTFNLPPMIITLGTQSVFRGVMQGVLGATWITVLPAPMKMMSETYILAGHNAVTGVSSKLPVSFLFLIVVAVVVALMLKFTMFGRGIYAIGGDENAAKRAGYHVRSIKFWLYCIVGVIAGLAGVTRTMQTGQMHPTNLLGSEMIVIASVVLGGASIVGGAGTVTGALLGTMLITIVQTSMLLLGISSFWQGFFTGVFILVGTGISAYQIKKQRQKLPGLKDV